MAEASPGAYGSRRIRVLRVIARMNVGGPAHHVAILTGRLDPGRYDSLLVTGRSRESEGSLEDLASHHGAQVVRLNALGPAVRPVADLRALWSLIRLVRGFRPDIVHTHTAKAGMLGRLAARLAGRPRPTVVHTYHGHVLTGYFGRVGSAVWVVVERSLARLSDRLIGVSQATVQDLVALGVAPVHHFSVIEVGLDLTALLAVRRDDRGSARESLGLAPGSPVLGYVGRLVAIKQVHVVLRAFARVLAEWGEANLLVVGDGDLREELEAEADRLGISKNVRFTGYRRDLDRILAATDVTLLASANEGTPVSLIESGAAGVPAVATDVGGVSEVVPEGAGTVVEPDDAAAIARAAIWYLEHPAVAAAHGERARAHVRGRFASGRLLSDIDRLYAELLDVDRLPG